MHSSVAAALLLCSFLAAQPSDRAAIQRGRAQFKSSCGFCHGEDATGNRAPDLVRSQSLNHDVNGDLLGPIIRNGRPDKGMPGFSSLSSQQISGIVAFLHRRAKDALESSRVPRDYPLEKLLTGNAASGKAFFNGAGGCTKCHSVTGDLAGVSNRYSPLDLQQRMLYPTNAEKRTCTITTPYGDTIDGVLVNIDEFTVGITTNNGAYKSWNRDKVKVEVHDPLAAHRELMPKYTDADVHNLFAYLETLR